MTRLMTALIGAMLAIQTASPWAGRLESLNPDDPMAYFELAEEIADASTDDSQQALARRLFALSGVLDPPRLGRSACLALADLEADEHAKRRLLALAALLDERAGGLAQGPAGRIGYSRRAEALAVSEALSFYRKGHGARALASLETPGAVEILDAYQAVFRGGAERFIEECRLYRNSRKPIISEQDLIEMLRVEAALLSGDERSWSGELLLTGGRPLIEVDPDRLDASFGINAAQACYLDGEWGRCD